MEEIRINEIMDMVDCDIKSLQEPEKGGDAYGDEGIRVFVPKRRARKKSTALLRFILLTAAFFLLFALIAYLVEGRADGEAENTEPYHQTVFAPNENEYEETTEESSVAVAAPIVIDESKLGIEIDTSGGDYSLSGLIEASDGVKVLIVHSHTSEYVSETISVTEAGRVISQILSSAGIETYHSDVPHDSEGNIGSYAKMTQTVRSLVEVYPDVVCVIDLHDSDSGVPLTFTVATDCTGWGENRLLAEAIGSVMPATEKAYRFIPGGLGQDSGVLTLNVGVCGKGYDDGEAREIVAAFAEAFIEICSKKASASP